LVVCLFINHNHRYTCSETGVKFWGVPKYTSAKSTEVNTLTSTKRKLESRCLVDKTKVPKTLKTAAGPVASSEAGPVGGAEACPALPKGIKLLSDAQRKRVAKMHDLVSSDVQVLAELIDEVGKECYDPYRPPFLLPRATVQQAALVEMAASLEGMLVCEWAGRFADCWDPVNPARQAAAGVRGKLQELVDEYRPSDDHGVPLDAKGKNK
jgi:hypothetical protein